MDNGGKTMISHDCIARNTCDNCDNESTGVLFHNNGTPTLFLCRSDAPTNYEHLARIQIDAWLDGGLAMNSYVVTREHLRTLEESAAQG
jgi:hypothetical protein